MGEDITDGTTKYKHVNGDCQNGHLPKTTR